MQHREGSGLPAARRALATALALGALAAFAPPAAAQDGGPEPELAPAHADAGAAEPAEPEPAEPPEPEPPEPAEDDAVARAREALRSAHLGELASRTRAALQRARPLLRPSDELAEIARRLPPLERELARLGHPARLARIPQLSHRELADWRQEWRHHRATLEAWQTALLDRSAALEDVRSDLVELRRTWADLRSHSETAGRPESRHDRIVESLEAVRAAASALDTQRAELLALQDLAADLALSADDVNEQLRAATHAYRDRLFVRDSAPIWRGLSSDGVEHASLASQARESWAQRTEAWRPLIEAQVSAILWQFLLVAVLSGLLLVLGHRSRRWPADDRTLEVARQVARRPFSTALVIVLVATPFAVPHAPVFVYDIVFFLLLLPLVRVLAPLAPAHVRPVLYVSAVLLFVTRVESMAPDGSELKRVLLFVESGGAIAGVLWWLRRAGKGEDRPTTVLRGVTGAGGLIVAAAFVANVLGYAFLAGVLMFGTSSSVYEGLALVAAVLIVQALSDLAIRSATGRRLRSFREHGELVHRRLFKTLAVVAGLLWAGVTLEAYGLGAPLADFAGRALGHEWHLGSLAMTLGRLGTAVVALLATYVLVRFVRFFLETDLLPAMKLEPGVDGAISGMTRYLVFAVGLIVALASLGIDASQIALVAGALGVGIGFGLQGIVANVIAGIVLMLERPVRLGDFIEVGPLVGRVDRIGLRSSTVRALDGAEVIVPNEKLISRELVNWTLSDRKRRLEVKVGVAYGTEPWRALEVLRGVAEAHAAELEGTPPTALFLGFGESSLDFALQFWTADFAEGVRIRSELGLHVHDALRQAGIEIPFPQRDLHLRTVPRG